MTVSDNKDFSFKDSIKIGLTTVEAKSKRATYVLRFISICVAIFMVNAACQPILLWFRGTKSSLPSISIFLPDPARANEGAFYQDGSVQRRGFEKALLDSEKVPNRLQVAYHYMKREDAAKDILAKMRQAYESENATYFIMTMSSKVGDIREHFMRWRKECLSDGKRMPILIATVASAPDIADANSGIVRWYVRSDEESTLLASYLRWKRGVSRVGIFYITRNPGQTDDSYGKYGMTVFRDRFLHSLKGERVECYGTTASTAREQVARFLSAFQLSANRETSDVGAYVVGYGDMVRDVMAELISQGFRGPVACTSTLTEPDWQPITTTADSRIATVLPRLSDPQGILSKDDRNVVFFFAKQTLTRILELTASDPAPENFIAHWMCGNGKDLLDQEYLANGDIQVHLNVVTAEIWR